MSELLQQVEQLLTPLLAEGSVELVDLTYQKSHGGWTLCVFLDKSGGITLDDCQNWSDRIGTLLDEKNILDHSYSLEVSSPGLYRPLKKLKDFQNFIGEKVDVRLYAPLNGQKNYHGVLLGATEENIRVRVEDSKEVELPRIHIAKANLNPEIQV